MDLRFADRLKNAVTFAIGRLPSASLPGIGLERFVLLGRSLIFVVGNTSFLGRRPATVACTRTRAEMGGADSEGSVAEQPTLGWHWVARMRAEGYQLRDIGEALFRLADKRNLGCVTLGELFQGLRRSQVRRPGDGRSNRRPSAKRDAMRNRTQVLPLYLKRRSSTARRRSSGHFYIRSYPRPLGWSTWRSSSKDSSGFTKCALAVLPPH